MSTEIVELRSDEDFRRAFPIVRELHHELDERRYAELLAEMLPNGYRMFALMDGDALVAVVGIQVLTNLYYERYVYVYDLVITENARSGGYGGLLMDHVEDLARREGCKHVALACGREREGALRFYEGRGYEKPSYAMRKTLSP